MIEWIKEIDTNLLIFINSGHTPFLDSVWFYVSKFYISIPIYAWIIFLLFKKFSYKQAFLLLLLMILTVVVADKISVIGFKNVFMRYRPTHHEELKHIVHIVNNYRGGLYGFVSSHAANTFSFAIVASCIFQRKAISIIVILWAVLVSYSRIYLAAHYPADIACGAILGTTVAIIAYYTLAKRIMRN